MRSTSLLLVVAVCVTTVMSLAPPFPYSDHCIIGEENKYNQTWSNQVPWFTIDLDKPPEERWLEVGKLYKTQIQELIGVIKSLSLPFFHGKLIAFVDKYMGGWDGRLKSPYKEELMGMANATGLPMGEIVLYNVFYEIFTVCTSIVAEDTNGKLYHARNLDFGLFMGWNHTTHNWYLYEKLRPNIINVKWTKNGTEVYKSVNFAGYIGVYNGLKKGAFTITMNERFNLNGGFIGLLQWLLGLAPNVSFSTFLVREVMETANTYDTAMDMLMTKELIAPSYYIIGGTKSGEGAVIARGRTGVADVHKLNTSSPDGWYVLETNYDLSGPTLYLDDRRTPGNACMNKMGRKNVGFEGIYNVLSSKTNLNKLTEYTVLMQVDSGNFETHLQDCPQPCWAF